MYYYKYAKFFLNSMLVLLLISCSPNAEVEVKPNIPLIPLVIAIDSNGQVGIKVSYELRTPIANIELSGGGSREIFSFRQNESVKDKRLLLVRVDSELTVYELVENQEFDIKLQNDKGYRKVRLVKEADEDIILELESIGNNNTIAIADTTPTRIFSTPTPTRRPLPTKTPRPAPTWTPISTPKPTNTPKPTPCPPPSGLFARLWQNYQDKLGCPLQGWNSDKSFPPYSFGEMPFQGGHMFVFIDAKQVYVTYGSGGAGWTGTGTWNVYPLTWEEGDPDFSCAQEQAYPQQPIQGFGEIWCKYPEVRQRLGWGIDRMRDQERESPGASVYRLQLFENGFIFRDSDGWTYDIAYVFFNNKEFVRTSYR